ncbi:kinase-like domain-containing protein [Glomus cerebriforme]|uniref:Kinase-like domain-containing protein n=1 Tax=Glomus cerebriforme TaxID=658196 RepID=A0A397SM17_9GLOM|nr:kinase-like domain-containing protein [Glomus cerebriforme]
MGNQQSLLDNLIHGNNRYDYSKHTHHHQHRKHSHSSSTSSFNSNFQSAFHFTSNSRHHNPKDCCALWKTIKSILGIWTTGNNDIDEIIKETQRTASKHHKPWKWIPFDRFEDIKFLAQGGYGHVYSAMCTDRDVCGKVALKSLEFSENISKEYLQQLRTLSTFEHSKGLIRIYGMTRDPETNDYMLVMKHAKSNLRQYINKHFNTLSLSNKIELLVPISNGLKRIHQADLVHGNLHPGNILQTIINIPTEKNTTTNSIKIYTMPQTWSYISDLGLCGPASNEPRKILSEKNDFVEEPDTIKNDDDIFENLYFHEKNDDYFISHSRRGSVYEKPKIYGVLPYIAPEVLRGQKSTKAADVYAFGFIVYEVFTGHPPYYDVPHDIKLAQKICTGHRPPITCSEIPPRIMKLITSCWDANPDERPSALDLHNLIRGWYWRLDPEMKSLMRADDESRSGTPIKEIGGFSTPPTPGTPISPFNFPTNTPFTTSLNTSISHSYSTTAPNISPQSTSSTMSFCGINGYEIHPEAIYTSRLLEYDNLPQTASWLF